MPLKHSRYLWTALAVAALLPGFQTTARADQRQTDADLRTAAQYQQAYQNDNQALQQAIQRRADRQTIQNLQSAVAEDVTRINNNARDLANDGVANPYPIPSYPESRRGFRWSENRAARPMVRLRDMDRDRDWDGNVSRNEWTNYADRFFDSYDADGNGVLSRSETNELRTGNRWEADDAPAQQTASDSFGRKDRNNDGFIAREEWRHSGSSFESLDLNRDNRLDRNEFFNRSQSRAAVFSELDQNRDAMVTRNEWRGTPSNFNALDVNANGALTESEFNSQSAAAGSSGSSSQQMIEQIFGQLFTQK